MRHERLLRFAGLAALGAFAVSGCVTTTQNGMPPEKVPRVSKADQALDGARVHTELGQHYLENGDLQSAKEKLLLAVQFDPNYAPAHTVLAVVYERINDMPDAEQHYRRAVELDPARGGPNNNLGAFLCKVGRLAEAAPYFQKAVEDPFYQTPDVAWTNAGVCLGKQQDIAGAEADFHRALGINPNNGDALFQLANTLYLNNDAQHAVAFIQRLDALGQPSPAALKLGHDIEMRLGNMEAASSYSRRLQSQFPESEQARALDTYTSP